MTWQNAEDWQALLATLLLVSAYTVLGTYIVPQIIYRNKCCQIAAAADPSCSGQQRSACVQSHGGLCFLHSLFELEPHADEKQTPEEHIEALISAGEEEGIIEKEDVNDSNSVVAFGDKTVREVMTPRPRIVAIRGEPARSKTCAA